MEVVEEVLMAEVVAGVAAEVDAAEIHARVPEALAIG